MLNGPNRILRARANRALAPALIALAPSAAPEIEALALGAALWRPAL